jgi:hypothetical protein
MRALSRLLNRGVSDWGGGAGTEASRKERAK